MFNYTVNHIGHYEIYFRQPLLDIIMQKVNDQRKGYIIFDSDLQMSIVLPCTTYDRSQSNSGKHYLALWSPYEIFEELSALIAKLSDCATLSFVMDFAGDWPAHFTKIIVIIINIKS